MNQKQFPEGSARLQFGKGVVHLRQVVGAGDANLQ